MDSGFDSDLIIKKRKSLELSQVALATLAGISLPTLQNIEAGRSNPTWDVIVKLLKVLKINIVFEPQQLDWSLLSFLGVPILPNKKLRKSILPAEAKIELKRALHDYFVLKKDFAEREAEALVAFMMALRDHEPTHFKTYKNLVTLKQLNQEIKKMDLGRLIKLRRLALSQIRMEILR